MPQKPSQPEITVKDIEDGLTLEELSQIHPKRLLKALLRRGISVEDILLYHLELKNAEITFASENPDMEWDKVWAKLRLIRKRRELLERILRYTNDYKSDRRPYIPTDTPQITPFEDTPQPEKSLPPQVTDPNLNPFAPKPKRRDDERLPN